MRFRVREKLLLSIGVPCAVLIAAEFGCRAIERWALGGAQRAAPSMLEMPTWMLEEYNTAARTVKARVDLDALEWLNLFEQGEGFRVRLVPNIRKEVVNTFSRLRSDRSKRYLIESNDLGFRSGPLPPSKQPGTFRVAVFGDSSSFGWGVNQDDSLSSLLPRLLEKRYPGRKFEAVNFAIPGDSSEYGRLIFEKFAAQIDADLVIIGFGANDAKKVGASHQKQVDRFRTGMRTVQIEKLLQRSSLIRVLSRLLRKEQNIEGAEKRATPAVRLNRYRENLKFMASRSIEYGAKNSLLLNLCTPGNYSKVARKIANNAGFLYFNGQSYLLSQLESVKAGKIHPHLVREMEQLDSAQLAEEPLLYLSSDGCHPNRLGHLLVAEALVEIIEEAGLI